MLKIIFPKFNLKNYLKNLFRKLNVLKYISFYKYLQKYD
jgi:hypothetical protein